MSAATRWTLVIVGLLAGNLVAMFILMTVAHSGASEIIPNYYDRAAHYNNDIDNAARSRALGWTTEVTLANSTISVRVHDAAGRAVDGASVHVYGYARAHARRSIDAALTSTGSGMYRRALAAPATGLHDLTVTVERDGKRFSTPVSIEAR